LERVNTQIVTEWGTRFAMMQTGDADFVDVNIEDRPQMDALVGSMRVFDLDANEYGPEVNVCGIDDSQLGIDRFTACSGGEAGTGGPFRLYIGRPQLQMDVIIYNFAIR